MTVFFLTHCGIQGPKTQDPLFKLGFFFTIYMQEKYKFLHVVDFPIINRPILTITCLLLYNLLRLSCQQWKLKRSLLVAFRLVLNIFSGRCPLTSLADRACFCFIFIFQLTALILSSSVQRPRPFLIFLPETS